jgi:hypothetical protein
VNEIAKQVSELPPVTPKATVPEPPLPKTPPTK